MWSNLLSTGEAAKERFASALKETNDVLSQRASAHAQQIKSTQISDNSNGDTKTDTAPTSPSVSTAETSSTTHQDQKKSSIFSFSSGVGTIASPTLNQSELFGSLQKGWGNVIEATKHVVETTRDAVEKEQTRIQATLFANGPYVRGKNKN